VAREKENERGPSETGTDVRGKGKVFLPGREGGPKLLLMGERSRRGRGRHKNKYTKKGGKKKKNINGFGVPKKRKRKRGGENHSTRRHEYG